MDPSRFPTDTRLRVGLVLVALSTVGLFFAYVFSLPEQSRADHACAQAAWQAIPTVHNAAEAARWARVWDDCRGPAQRSAGLGMVGGLDFLFLGVGVYATQVGWRLRNNGMRPLEGQLQEQVAGVVRRHSAAARLTKPPHIYLDVRAGATPSVFGKVSQPILAVSQGTLVDFVGERRRFDAVIHHELFHLRGNDVRTYYRALAVFRAMFVQSTAFVLIITGGLVIQLGETTEALIVGAQFLVIIALGFATLRDYLRRREFHADMWAVDQTGDTATVESLLRSASGPRPIDRLLRIIHSHPTVNERVRALHDRRRALTFSPGAAFLTAMAIGLLCPTIALFLPLFGVHWTSTYEHGIAGTVCGAVLGRVLAIGVWRNVHLDLIASVRVRSGLTVGLGAAVGLLAGGLLPLHLVFERGGPGIPFSVALVTMVVVSLTVFCRWVAFCARLRLGADPEVLDQRAYMWGLRVATIVAAGLLTAVYFLAGMVQGSRASEGLVDADLPHLDPAQAPTESQLTHAFLTGLTHDWRAYVILGLALAWPAAARAGSRLRPPADRRSPAQQLPVVESVGSTVGTAPVNTLSTEAMIADEPVTAIAVGAGRPRRAWLVLVLACVTVSLLAAATGRTATLLFVVVIAFAALLLAWLAYLGNQPSRPLLTGVYLASAVTGVLVTLPFQQYQSLSLIAVGLIGTTLYTRIGMPVPGNRHVFILLSAGLLLHHKLWILLAWLLIGPLIGLALYKVLDGPTDEHEPPLWLGFAFGGVVSMALEAFLV